MRRPIGRDPMFSPSEEECQERPGQIQPLVAVMISVVQLSSAQSRQQEPVHHITERERQKEVFHLLTHLVSTKLQVLIPGLNKSQRIQARLYYYYY